MDFKNMCLSIIGFVGSDIKSAFISECMDVAVSAIHKGVESEEWKRLFVATGKDCFSIFNGKMGEIDKRYLKKLSREIRCYSGLDLKKEIYNGLFDQLQHLGLTSEEAEKYIDTFVLNIIGYLKEKDTQKYLEVYLADCRESIEKDLKQLNKIIELATGAGEIYTVQQEDARLKLESAVIKIGLDFYELDDAEFADTFDSKITDESIYVKGNSKEETILRILAYIQKKYPEKDCYVVRSSNAWKNMAMEGKKGCILVPDFYAESIVPIPDNTNIFVYSVYESCYGKDSITLRRRTISNIIEALERQGMDGNEANKLVTVSHGQYSSMKRKLYTIAEYKKVSWSKRDKNILTALLCGSWTEMDKDKEVIERLSGESYSNFKEKLTEYIFNENCFLLQYENHETSLLQVACIEEAWEELDIYVTTNDLKEFLEVLKDVLLGVISGGDAPVVINKVYKNSHYSNNLIHGMLNTLIMRTCYKNHTEFQSECDQFVRTILQYASTLQGWGNLSDYFCQLCEISPEECLAFIEKEIETDGTLIWLFKNHSQNVFFGRDKYVDILFGLQRLMNVNTYTKRVIDVLWKLDALNISYSLANTPKEILTMAFCAWYPSVPVNSEQKINMAKEAIDQYPNAWDVIFGELNNRSLTMPDLKFQYRANTDIDNPTNTMVIEIYTAYFDYCLETAGMFVHRWETIISYVYKFGEKKEEEALKKLMSVLPQWDDSQKSDMYVHLRKFIYHECFYKNKKLSEDRLSQYEKALSEISFTQEEYKYAYLFLPEFKFPLLHPNSYKSENADENIYKYRDELEREFKVFKQKNLNLETLVKLHPNTGTGEQVGNVIAQFYTDTFDKEVFKSLMNGDETETYCVQYVEFYHAKNLFDFTDLLKLKQHEEISNDIFWKCILVLDLDSEVLQFLETATKEEKEFYWQHEHKFSITVDKAEFHGLFEQCAVYGGINTYILLLYRLREKFSKEELLRYFLKINEMDIDNVNSNTELLFTILDEELYESFSVDDDAIVNKMAAIEVKCADVIDFESYGEMHFFNRSVQNNPEIFIMIMEAIFGKEQNCSPNLYHLYYDCTVCLAEKDGEVNYEELLAWIYKYTELINEKKLEEHAEYALGRLLNNGPVGNDGIQPCEAIRKYIEDNWSDKLGREFMTAEFNKRGAYEWSAGKENLELSNRYAANAQALVNKGYPKTAKIYRELSSDYKMDAESERRVSEYER